MAEQIQFPCPACGALLHLPRSMAGQRGPCPTCQQVIIAPDPAQGLGAKIAKEPLPQVAPAKQATAVSRRNTAEWPPPKSPKQPPAAAPTPTLSSAPASSGNVRKSDLVLSCLLAAAVALAIGYALGVRSAQLFMRLPAMPNNTVAAPIAAPPPRPEPTPIFVKPIIANPPSTKPTAAPLQATAAAEASLRAFLSAPDWAARNSYVLDPDSVKSAMEAYSQQVPDGPTPFKSLAIQQSQIDSKSGNTIFIFQVITAAIPSGIPVAVVETASGWLVDWQTFIEFRDDLFKQFVGGPPDLTKRFHLIVTQAPVTAENRENDHFDSFILEPPLPDRRERAFAKKHSFVATTCQTATANGGIFTPLVEITKRTTAEGKSYLEISKIIATDWLPSASTASP